MKDLTYLSKENINIQKIFCKIVQIKKSFMDT